MLWTVNLPGPANQKSVPGLSQRRPVWPASVTCSASSPAAIEPVALISTPPWTGVEVTAAWPLGAGDGVAACLGAGGVFTGASVSVPGLLRVATGGPLLVSMWLMAAWPAPVEPPVPAAMTATRAVGEPVNPGAGHARTTPATAAAVGGTALA